MHHKENVLRKAVELLPKDPDAIATHSKEKGVQPADAEYGYLIVPKLWEGFWTHFDWNRAAADGMKEAGLKYSGKIKFVNTLMHWPINHGVVPKQKTLSCTHCHRPDGVMDFKALGYPNDPAVSGGRFEKGKP